MSLMHTSLVANDTDPQTPSLGTLVVVILKARNLHNRRRVSKQNPFCTIRVSTYSYRTKTIVRGGQSPLWDHEVRFVIRDRPDHKELRISVFDQDKNDTHLIGESKINLGPAFEAARDKGFDGWHELRYQNQFVGEVFLEMTFYKRKSSHQNSKIGHESQSKIPQTTSKLDPGSTITTQQHGPGLSTGISAGPSSKSHPHKLPPMPDQDWVDRRELTQESNPLRSSANSSSSCNSGRRLPPLPPNAHLSLTQQWAGSSSDITESIEDREIRERREKQTVSLDMIGGGDLSVPANQIPDRNSNSRPFNSVPNLHSHALSVSNDYMPEKVGHETVDYRQMSSGPYYGSSMHLPSPEASPTQRKSGHRIPNELAHSGTDGHTGGYAADPLKAMMATGDYGLSTAIKEFSLSSTVESGGLRRSPLATWTQDPESPKQDYRLEQQDISRQIDEWYGASLFR